MEDKWFEITVLAGTNVLTVIIVALLNILASYCTRYEDTEQHQRKYTVAPRNLNTRKQISTSPKHSKLVVSTNTAASTATVPHGKESGKLQTGSTQKKHS